MRNKLEVSSRNRNLSQYIPAQRPAFLLPEKGAVSKYYWRLTFGHSYSTSHNAMVSKLFPVIYLHMFLEFVHFQTQDKRE